MEGKGAKTWIKHELLKTVVSGQIAVLQNKFKGQGLIIDMHAGDGNGVEIERGQLDLLRPNVSTTTPAIACSLASLLECAPQIVLCETVPTRRHALEKLYGHQAVILPTNKLLLRRVDLSVFAWAIVMNDPNGPNRHAVEVMQHIAAQIRPSDFVIVVNESALCRLGGVRSTGEQNGANAAMIEGVRAIGGPDGKYAWMIDAEAWRKRLGKAHVARATIAAKNRAFHGRVLLVSNYISDGVRRGLFDAS